MRELIDCHVHTARCGHAVGSAADCMLAALLTGLSAIVITEYLPLPDGLDEAGCYAMSALEIPEYARELTMAVGGRLS